MSLALLVSCTTATDLTTTNDFGIPAPVDAIIGGDTSDLFTPIEGLIVYRSESEPSELMALDPLNPE